MITIYVGNLPLEWGEQELRAHFAPHGPIGSVTLITEPETGLSRGFGFVVMPDEAARVAIEDLDGLEIEGCFLRVNESRDRGAKPPRREY